MGLTQKLGTIPLAIFTDSSNNVGIGGSPSGSYKFEVTGTGRFTGALTAASAKFSGSRPQGIFTENGTTGLYLRDATSSSYKSWSIGTNDIVVGFAITPSTAVNGTTFTTPALVINESSNVGIGTSNPQRTLEVVGTIRNTNPSSTNFSQIYNDATGAWFSTGAYPMMFETNGTERMRILSNGNTLIGTSTDQGVKFAVNGTMAQYTSDATAGYVALFANQNTSGGGTMFIDCYASSSSYYALRVRTNNGNSYPFQVRSDGYLQSATTYNNTTSNAANISISSSGYFERSTSSSIRFKDNIQDWNGNGLDTILALKPKTFKYKKDYYDKADIDFLGLIAEEVAEVSPYLADFENEDRTGQVENVRYANIVVPIIKAIQELSAKVSALENKS